MKRPLALILLVACLFGGTVSAQEEVPRDSVIDSLATSSVRDTAVVPGDSLAITPTPDSAALPADSLFSAPADSTAPADSSLVAPGDFEERYARYRKEKLERTRQLSFDDTALVYLAPQRLSVRDQVQRSFYHDAGDFFRFDPSYFVLDRQATPMRKTVRPFGLSSGRLNLIVNRQVITPFEHVVEPDGLVDMNDVPTAFAGDI